jgi:hypothetical protein
LITTWLRVGADIPAATTVVVITIEVYAIAVAQVGALTLPVLTRPAKRTVGSAGAAIFSIAAGVGAVAIAAGFS